VDSSLVIVGLSSRTSSSNVRERFWMDEIARSEAAARLARAEGISEVVVLVTSERTEYIVWADDPSEAANSILQLLSQKFGLKLCEWKNFYRVTDKAAIAHVFSLLCGSRTEDGEDVAMLREALKSAWTQARAAGTSGRMLDTLFTRAFALVDANSARPASMTPEAIGAEAKTFQKKLLAERLVPAAAIVRVRVEEICRQELDALERTLGPLNEPQKNALAEMKVRVTKRIAGEVEHELKGLKQTARQQNLAETAQRLIDHGQMRDLISRSQN
jgi:glutamyl-tRNA reductase